MPFIILLLFFFISLIFLFLIKKGKIVKHSRFLLWANIIYIGLLLLSLFAFFVLTIVEILFETYISNINKGDVSVIVFSSLLIGFAVFICNVCVLLSNWFSKDK